MKKKGFSFIKMLFFIVLLLLVFIFSINFYKKIKDADESNIKEDIKIETNDTTESDNQIESTFNKLYFTLENSLLQSAQNYIILYGDSSLEMIIPYSKLKEHNLLSNLVDPKNSNNLCNGYVTYDGKGNYEAYLSCPNNYETENYNKDFE